MEELLKIVAELRGMPAAMVQRSAAARAKATGVSVEDVLRGWAGEAAPEGTPAPPSTARPEPAAAPVAAPAAEVAVDDSGPAVEVIEPAAAPPPRPDDEREPSEQDVEPRTALSGFPRWLAAAFLVIPAAALLYGLQVPNGPDCGSSGQLAVNPVTGDAENCDGSPYGVDVVNYFAQGQSIYEARCVSCHGAEGGGGTGPAFAGGAVLVTFGEGRCASHVEWVAVGTDGWPDATYGDNNKPVGGSGAKMPAFENVLSADELAAVVLYERVAFGGEPLPTAEADCGLAEAGAVASP